MDIGFGWSVPKAPGECIQSLVLSREPLAAVPAQNVHVGRATITLAELAAKRFVTFSPGYGSALNAALEDLCEEAGIEPRLGLTAARITTLVPLVAAERGGAIVPGFTSTLQRSGAAYVPWPNPACSNRLCCGASHSRWSVSSDSSDLLGRLHQVGRWPSRC
ncbi:LysR family substrate-binding domain-containing protein [Burkholderia sp. GS2Y]|uniref:LysR family substrate-binding domain-containing protein n=1 Tax=Burkholderia theae TaxID=3143496 RepID=A0ABU9WTG6_9BURK